jgi:hypothetical protein
MAYWGQRVASPRDCLGLEGAHRGVEEADQGVDPVASRALLLNLKIKLDQIL